MRLHWPGFYGLGMVTSILGVIWLPQYTQQFLLSALLMGLAVGWAFVMQNVQQEKRDGVLRQPEPETIYQAGGES